MRRETGITIIEARQNRPIPKLPYGDFWVSDNGARIGGQDEIRVSDDDKVSLHGLRTATITLNIYGQNAGGLMSRLVQSLDWPRNIEDFDEAGIAHTGENGPNDLTGLWETKDVERSQLDLFISYGFKKVETEEDPIGVVAEVEVTHEDTPMGDETFNVTSEDE